MCMSMKGMGSEKDSINREMKTIRSVLVGSTDVKALYPSLDISFTVEKVCEATKDSEIEFEGMWYEEIRMYLAIN